MSPPKLMLLSCGVGEDSWESLGLQWDQTSHTYRNQSWIFIGKTDAEAEAPVLWPPDTKSQLTGKKPGIWKDWRQEEKMTEDEMVGWHHRFNGHEFWASSRTWWRTGKPVMLQSMGLQRFRHGWETEQHDEDWITAVSKSPISMSLFLHSLNNLLRIVYVKQLNFPLISIRWWVDQFTLSHFGSENECRENFEVH